MSEVIDNRANRIRTLKQIIQQLHSGEAKDAVKAQLKNLVERTDACEIMSMEQELIAGGMPVDEIRSMCDLHSQVTREVLVQLPPRTLAPGHPVDTFRRENAALRDAVERMRAAIGQVSATAADEPADGALFQWRQALNDLMDIDKHYQRKEHTVFSCLERHGITGPSKVMWAKDDEVRALLKDLYGILQNRDSRAGAWKSAEGVAERALQAVEEMIYKEENILLPMCLQTFTEAEWAEIWSASPRYGWCLVEPRSGYEPPRAKTAAAVTLPQDDAIQLPTGNLTLAQLTALFSTLPVDITFVDVDDRVRFFSEGPDRVFARSKAIIGRKVQHCHPPKSVDVVDRILEDFRSGRQSVAEFWLNFHHRFVHVRYFAVRESGQYLGTLEVTQDLTRLRTLDGERRLLQYETGT